MNKTYRVAINGSIIRDFKSLMDSFGRKPHAKKITYLDDFVIIHFIELSSEEVLLIKLTFPENLVKVVDYEFM